MPSHPSVDSTQDSIFSQKDSKKENVTLPHSDSSSEDLSSDPQNSAGKKDLTNANAQDTNATHNSLEQHNQGRQKISSDESITAESSQHQQQHIGGLGLHSTSPTPKITPLKNPLNKANHARRFSRSGFNLGITITDTPTGPDDVSSPIRRSVSLHRRANSTVPLPVVSSNLNNTSLNATFPRNSFSANNSPVAPQGFQMPNSFNGPAASAGTGPGGLPSHARSMSLKRSSSLYHSNPSSPFFNKSFQQQQQNVNTPVGNRHRTGLSRSLSTSVSMKSLHRATGSTASSVDSTGEEQHTNTIQPVPPAASKPTITTPIDETSEKLRTLALKEMRVVELRDKIKNLSSLLEKEVKELHEMRKAVQKSLYQDLGSANSKLHSHAQHGHTKNGGSISPQRAAINKSRNRTNSLLGGLLGTSSSNESAANVSSGLIREENESNPLNTSNQNAAKNSAGAQQRTSPANKRSSVWDSISKPLNLFSQFDTMLQTEFEKISNGGATNGSNSNTPLSAPESKTRFSPVKNHSSPKKNKQQPQDSSFSFENDDDDFFKWDDGYDDSLLDQDTMNSTPSKKPPSRDLDSKPKTVRKSSLVLSKNSSKLANNNSNNQSNNNSNSSGNLKLSRNPSYRKSVNLDDHKIILPKRNKNRNFKDLFDEKAKESEQATNGINNPIIDLASSLDTKSSPVVKDPNEVLQTVSSSLWNFYSDVKDGLLLSIEEERAMQEANNKNRANGNKHGGIAPPPAVTQHNNLSMDNLIDLDSSPEKYTPEGAFFKKTT